jgi:predicted nucleotidyltransferase
MLSQLKPLLNEFRQALIQYYGDRLSKIILYGSQARNDATENSDIDVMIVLSKWNLREMKFCA